MDDFPIIVISLRDSVSRRDAISKMMHSLELPFIFHDAVDGRQGLPPECEKEVDRALTQRTLDRGMSNTEYACALSHFAVYEYILKNKLIGAIVLEDDAIVGKGFRYFVTDQHYLNYNMVFLAHGSAYAYPKTKENLHRIQSAIYKLKTNPDRTTGYSILSCVAQRFIETMKPIHKPADVWPCDLSDVQAAIAHPSIVGFDEVSESTIIRHEQKMLMLREIQKRRTRHFKSYYWKKKLWKIKMQLLYKYIPCSTKDVS